MPYRQGNFSYVADTNFNPYQSLQEMLIPFTAYKDAYEKTEAAYDDLVDKTDTFKYLEQVAKDNPKSTAAQIYKGYADEMHKQFSDFSKHGLNMGNKRALTNLKRRYKGEIGRLVDADTAMQEERKLRRTMNAKDSSMLYAQDNLSIDDFLDGATPNLYNISGEELRKEGAQYAQAASSRIYGNTQVQNITKYFQEIMQTQGYSPKIMAAFRQNLESVPEFNQAVQDIMDARGVTGNLTGHNYERARQSIINGIMEGALYKESRSVQQNPGVMTAAQQDASARGWAGHNLQAAAAGMVKDSSSPTGYRYDVTQDPKYKTSLWMYNIEDGQIKGYSKEYLDAVKNGTAPTNPTKPGSSPKKQTTPKETKVDLLENESYNTANKHVGPAPSGPNADYGEEIEMAEAQKLAPNLVKACGEYVDYYKFYRNGTRITRRRIHNSIMEDSNTTDTISTPWNPNRGGSDEHNEV